MNIWFTSDTHFGHQNIIKHCSRPFGTAKEMDDALIENFNAVVKKNDLVYHLGDVAWAQGDLQNLMSRLSTRNIHLVRGNHDGFQLSRYERSFQTVSDLKNVMVGCIPIVLCHYPIASWKNKGHGAYHLFGHCHGTYTPEGRCADVGVDVWDYKPVNWETLHEKLKNNSEQDVRMR